MTMRLQSKINKLADKIITAGEGYRYIYDPDHSNKPHGNYFETEKGWSNDPQHDPKNQQQPVQPPQSQPTTRVNQVNQQFMEGYNYAPAEFLDQLLQEPVGQGRLGYKDIIERNKLITKKNDELIDERLNRKDLWRGIRELLSDIEKGTIKPEDIIGKQLWTVVPKSFSPIVIKSVDHLKEIYEPLVDQMEELRKQSNALFLELGENETINMEKSAQIKNLFHRSLFIKTDSQQIQQGLAYPRDEQSKPLVTQFASAIQWASRIIDWKKTDAPALIAQVDQDYKRANYVSYYSTIKLQETDDDGVYIHELGHHLETKNASVGILAKQFYAKRTEGHPLVKLQDLVPWGKYDDDEYARDDSFINKYSGKVYKDGTTELVSTGLEHLFRDPIKFRLRDPEHFMFTMSVLRLVRHEQH